MTSILNYLIFFTLLKYTDVYYLVQGSATTIATQI